MCILTDWLQDGLESFDNRGLRRAQTKLQEKQRKASDRTVRTVATQSRSDRHRVSGFTAGNGTSICEPPFACYCISHLACR